MDERTVYDDIADIFMSSLAAQVSGVTRAEFIARIREKWPTEEEARAGFESIRKMASAKLDEAQREAMKRNARIVGIAYPVKKP